MPRFNIDQLPQKYRDQANAQIRDNNTNPPPNVERIACNVSDEKKEGARFHTRVHVHIHSVRSRLADPDGISGKAAIDGLVKAGILADDSAKEVEGVTHSQSKCEDGQEERTVITIKELE